MNKFLNLITTTDNKDKQAIIDLINICDSDLSNIINRIIKLSLVGESEIISTNHTEETMYKYKDLLSDAGIYLFRNKKSIALNKYKLSWNIDNPTSDEYYEYIPKEKSTVVIKEKGDCKVIIVSSGGSGINKEAIKEMIDNNETTTIIDMHDKANIKNIQDVLNLSAETPYIDYNDNVKKEYINRYHDHMVNLLKKRR